jgi:hypothetical protein
MRGGGRIPGLPQAAGLTTGVAHHPCPAASRQLQAGFDLQRSTIGMRSHVLGALPGALADCLIFRPLSWPFPRYPPEASPPGQVIPGFLALPASDLRAGISLLTCSIPSVLSPAPLYALRTQPATRPVQVSATETTNRKAV